MKCRICNYKCKKIYSTINLPECIWPTKKKSTFSKIIIYSCLKCCHLQLQNFSKKKISSFYGDTQYVLSKSDDLKKKVLLIKKEYGKNFFKNKKILDVGGGTNPVFKNTDTYILDFKVQKEIKKLFKKRYYEQNIEDQTIQKKFDIIFLMHTLEHFKYPGKAIKNVKNLLNKDGRLFVEIPNFNYYLKKNTYYSIFHQHLSLFTLKHLKNLLNFYSLKIEKLFIEGKVIYCSIKHSDIKGETLSINNEILFKLLKKNYTIMKKKVYAHLKNNKFDIYGAGGAMVLLINSIKKVETNIRKIFDNQTSKQFKIFPGTDITILKNEKSINAKEIYSLSSYNISKKNNLNINKI
tara:strand:+ start:2088 stop:3137 length:1050 start_codon:yes stop_codon:yes gene_type:complete